MKSLQLAKPHLLIVIGVPGSGKTTFAQRFSDTFSAPFINSAQLQAVTVDQQAHTWLIDSVFEQLLKTKQTLIYEPASGTRAERAEIARIASKAGYMPLIVWVQTDAYVAETRSTKKTRSNPDPLTADEFAREAKRFTAPGHNEKYVVISGMRTYASQAKVVLKRLSEHSTRQSAAPAAPERSEVRPQQRRSVTVQ